MKQEALTRFGRAFADVQGLGLFASHDYQLTATRPEQTFTARAVTPGKGVFSVEHCRREVSATETTDKRENFAK